MLSFEVLDGTFWIEVNPSAKRSYYVHFIEDNGTDYGVAFIGSFTACLIYCKQRQIEYLECEIEKLKNQEESILYTEEE